MNLENGTPLLGSETQKNFRFGSRAQYKSGRVGIGNELILLVMLLSLFSFWRRSDESIEHVSPVLIIVGKVDVLPSFTEIIGLARISGKVVHVLVQ